MKFVTVEPTTCEELTTDGDIIYRRYNSEAWERQYGESWESCYSEEPALENAYREFEERKK